MQVNEHVSIYIEEGLSIYASPGSKSWRVRCRVDGKSFRPSTKIPHGGGKKNIPAAKEAARALYYAQGQTTQSRDGEMGDNRFGMSKLETLDRERYFKKKGFYAFESSDAYDAVVADWTQDYDMRWKILGKHFERGDKLFDPAAVTNSDLESFVAYCVKRGNRPQSWKKHLQALRRGLKLAADKYDFPVLVKDSEWDVFMSTPDSEPKESQRGKAWPRGTLTKYLDVLGRDTEAARQVMLIAFTGARLSEMKRMKASDLIIPADATEQFPAVLYIDPRKGGKKRKPVALEVPAYESFKAQLAQRDALGCKGDDLWSGKNYRKRRATACRALNLPLNITARDLRATWITGAHEAHPEDEVANRSVSGHTTTKMWMRYVHSLEDVKIKKSLKRKYRVGKI